MYWVNKELIKRLVGRFQLEMTPRSSVFPTTLYPIVVPVTNVDQLLKQEKAETLYDADPGANGWALVHTVGSGKRQTFRAFHIYRSSGATTVTSELSVEITQFVSLVEWAASDNHVQYMNPTFTLPEGAKIHILVTGWVVGETIVVQSLYDEEDAY